MKTRTTFVQESLIDEAPDDLFQLQTHTCADCGQPFETSRKSARCALCASLRAGEVGPALVTCPACDLEHRVPVLSPTKLCGPCRADLVITAGALRAKLDAFEGAADDAYDLLMADLAHADDADRARYDAACERAAEWPAERWARARDAAIAKGDGLSPLLIARQTWDEAAAALDRVRARVEQGMEEIERAAR